MFEGLDGERASSVVVLLVALVLVGYAVCATAYLLLRDDARKPP